MKKTLQFLLAFAFISFALVSCGPNTESDLCEYDGYAIMSMSAEESECGCGKIHVLHLRNEHKFKDVRVNEGAYKYYSDLLTKAKADSTVVKIECKQLIELQGQEP